MRGNSSVTTNKISKKRELHLLFGNVNWICWFPGSQVESSKQWKKNFFVLNVNIQMILNALTQINFFSLHRKKTSGISVGVEQKGKKCLVCAPCNNFSPKQVSILSQDSINRLSPPRTFQQELRRNILDGVAAQQMNRSQTELLSFRPQSLCMEVGGNLFYREEKLQLCARVLRWKENPFQWFLG